MVLGIDYGDARTGYALSDPSGILARSLLVYAEKSMPKVVSKTLELIKEHKVDKIVLGLPKNMNGTVGERGKKTKRFLSMLEEETDVPVIMWDERLTTVSAHNLMNETNVRGKKRKESVDKIAAAFILQSYLDSPKNF